MSLDKILKSDIAQLSGTFHRYCLLCCRTLVVTFETTFVVMQIKANERSVLFFFFKFKLKVKIQVVNLNSRYFSSEGNMDGVGTNGSFEKIPCHSAPCNNIFLDE